MTAHSLGTAEITAASHSDSIIKATCDVDVIANKVTGIRLSVPPYQTFTLTEKPDGTYLMNLAEKSQCQLIATLEPVGIQNKKVTWESSDSDMVQVYSNGTLVSSLLPEGVNSISVVITAKVKEDNVTAMCTVTIVRGGSTGPEPTGAVLIIEPTYLRVDEGTTTQLTALIYPEDTYAGVVTWWSSKRDIATVSDKGLVTTLKPGSTIITAETTTGLIASCLVNVMPTSGIGGVESDDPVGIRPVTGGLEISGLAESTFVGVYNILGVPVFARKAGSPTLTVGIPARGTYIVRIGNRVRKIVI